MWSESFLREKHRRMNLSNIDKRSTMRKEYDFSEARKNPYASQLKKQITIRLDEDSIGYFKEISEQVGIPYQSLINLYLRDCAAQNRKLDLRWKWSVNLLARNSPWVLDAFPKKDQLFFPRSLVAWYMELHGFGIGWKCHSVTLPVPINCNESDM